MAVKNTFFDNLRPASWRGVPFQVNGDDAEFGRHVVVHEFPQRDKPYVEDLGRKVRKFKLDAWVCAHKNNGFNPWPERDALIEAVEAGDVGTLVHPIWGSMQGYIVNVQVKQTVHGNAGFVSLVLEFVEAGELEFRAYASVDTEGQVVESEQAVYDAVTEDFSSAFDSGF